MKKKFNNKWIFFEYNSIAGFFRMYCEVNTQSSLNHQLVDIEGISIHVVEAGLDVESTLFFLHGWPELDGV